MLTKAQCILLVIFSILFTCDRCRGYQLITVEDSTYEPTWDSLDSRPLPKWFDAAKVGIFLHWGVYSVPTYGTEWFWKYWRADKRVSYVNFMKSNYKPGFTYQEFAPHFTAEHFDANEWAKLFQDSGAKYLIVQLIINCL